MWKVVESATDFDTAEFIKDGNKKEVVTLKGTRAYTDPVVFEKHPYKETFSATSLIDLYSVGAILYQLVTGRIYQDNLALLDNNLSRSRPEEFALGNFIRALLNKEFETFEQFYEEARN